MIDRWISQNGLRLTWLKNDLLIICISYISDKFLSFLFYPCICMTCLSSSSPLTLQHCDDYLDLHGTGLRAHHVFGSYHLQKTARGVLWIVCLFFFLIFFKTNAWCRKWISIDLFYNMMPSIVMNCWSAMFLFRLNTSLFQEYDIIIN